jgi:predicted dehydrogenase
MRNKVRLGIIGCGTAGHRHGRAIAASPEVQFVACADENEAAVASFAKRFGCESTSTDHRNLLQESTLDGVVIAVWPTTQVEVVHDAIDLGHRNLLCQAPLAANAVAAQNLLRRIRETGAFVHVAHPYEHHPAHRMMIRLRNTPALGDLDSMRLVNSTFAPDTGPSFEVRQGWRHHAGLGAGAENELLQAPIHTANRLAGSEPVSVIASGRMSGVNRTWLSIEAIVNYQNGLKASLRSSKLSFKEQTLHLSFRNGSLSLPDAFDLKDDAELTETRIGNWGENVTDRRQIKAIDPETRLLELFARDAAGASPMEDTLEHVLKDVSVTEAILDSLETGTIQPVHFSHLTLHESQSRAA